MVRRLSPSDVLTLKQARRIVSAVQTMCKMGLRPSIFVTIHLERARVANDSHKFITAFIKHARDWLRGVDGGPFLAVWVLENPSISDEEETRGLHLHLLAFVPRNRIFRALDLVDRWAEKSGARIMHPNTVYAIRTYAPRGRSDANSLDEQLEPLLGYLVKGVRSDDAETIANEFGVWNGRNGFGRQGRIYGKRCGVPSKATIAKAAAAAARMSSPGPPTLRSLKIDSWLEALAAQPPSTYDLSNGRRGSG